MAVCLKKGDFINEDRTRITLAYRDLKDMPFYIVDCLGDQVENLDLSYNSIKDLSFLVCFPYLHTLVLDRNPNLDYATLPFMPRLQILWLNNCNIININDWLQAFRSKCPNLKQLSMMCNPVGLTTLNGVTDLEELQYRREVYKILPSLVYFDGTILDRGENQKSVKKPIILKKIFKNFVSSIL